MDKVLKGKNIYSGVAIGKLYFYGKNIYEVHRRKIRDIAEETARYEMASKEAVRQLQDIYEKSVREIGEKEARIFESHRIILEDEEFQYRVKDMISKQRVNAAYAVAVVRDQFVTLFSGVEDEIFRAKAMDVKDVSQRLIRILDKTQASEGLQEKCILMAEDLAPSEAVALDKQYLQGLVTKAVGTNSHTAILAKTMNLPAVTGIEISPDFHGKLAILDGFSGKVILDPDQETLRLYQQKLQEEEDAKQMLLQYKDRKAIDSLGRRIFVYANIGDVSELESAIDHGAEGIGLFRSELLYMKGADYPSEEALFYAYRQAAEVMQGRPVIIRTIDMGADKKIDYFQLEEEANPALGYRGIRICLTREEIFKTQLRAILRASAYGNVAVMYPMITSLWEVQRAKRMLEEVRKDFEREGIPYGELPQGIMIETPAAALISDLLAREVDFFSIGTNDLTQYTLAVDRMHPKLDMFYDAYHEGVMRLIRMTVQNAHEAGIKVGICGELAADTSLMKEFMKIGIDDLSVAPSKVLAVKKAIIDR